MPGPSEIDSALGDLSDIHSLVSTRLRVWYYGGPNRDPHNVRAALQEYVDTAMAIIRGRDDVDK
jgi:hypothetical protein